MILRRIAICLICTLHLCLGWDWANEFDGIVHFECPAGQAISAIHSEHHNYYEDRRWAFRCRSTSGQHSFCAWTSHYVNDWDDFFNYRCSSNGFICGIYSKHANYYEDRRFRFKCCRISGVSLTQCQKTFRNDYDGPNTVNAQAGYVIKGVTSTHSNKYEDRQYSWDICKLEIVM